MADAKEVHIAPQGDLELVMTRDFDAPRELVWDAWTKPELLKRWYGPEGWSLAVCEIDLRPGGAYRFEMRNEGGGSMGWGGEYVEVTAPARFVQTEEHDQKWFEGGSLNTSQLTAHAGGTTFQATFRYPTTATRDMMLNSGMVDGYRASFITLDGQLKDAVANAESSN